MIDLYQVRQHSFFIICALLYIMSCCSDCGSAEHSSQQAFVISCGHILCGQCFLKVSLGRGCTPYFRCPECNAKCSSARFESYNKRQRISSTREGQAENDDTSMTIHIPQSFNQQIDPVRYFIHEQNEESLQISMIFYDHETHQYIHETMDFPSLQKSGIIMDAKELRFLEKLFLKLHTIIMKHDENESKQADAIEDSLTPIKFRDLAENDNSVLTRLLTSLASGVQNESMNRNHELWLKRIRAAFLLTIVL